MAFTGYTNEYLDLRTIDSSTCKILKKRIEGCLTILWFQDNDNLMLIDGKEESFKKNEVVFLTEFHQVHPIRIGKIRFLRFNRPFYCVLDHDSDVGCKGILFFGASQLPIITIPLAELEKFDVLWQMFEIEMASSDNLQIEMLQMMLKRYLILCARIYKTSNYSKIRKEAAIIREYNFLVEQYFHQKHSVTEYAALMHKSPKTLSNVFSKMGSKTPLKYIQERIMLEARRLLIYTNKSIKEITYELGYEDIQAFSHFFKRQEGISPSEFKTTNHLGNITNS